MMNDLQLLFRLDTGSVTARRTPVPLLEVVESVAAERVRRRRGDRRSTTSCPRWPTAGTSWHVVQNLLDNALAYGGAAGARSAPSASGDVVVLVVQDSGPGIPEELVPNLFDRFMRGAGLGCSSSGTWSRRTAARSATSGPSRAAPGWS